LPICHGGKNDKANIVWIEERKHRAWNILTNNSQMTCGEIAEELSKYIPRDLVFVVKRRDAPGLEYFPKT